MRASILRPGGALVEAGDTSAVALWELPHTRDQAVLPVTSVRSIEPEIPHIPAIKKEWKEAVRRAKEKYIGLDGPLPQGRVRPHYHLDFLARNPHIPKVEGRRVGRCPAVSRHGKAGQAERVAGGDVA